MRTLAVIFYLLLQGIDRTIGHGIGEHGLTGEEPTGDPTLPEITGPFELEFNVRYNSLSPGYQALLEYTDSNNNQETLFFACDPGTGEMLMYMSVGGELSECFGSNANAIPTVGELHSIKMNLDSTGKASMFLDGILITECSDMNIPTNTARIHTIGGGTYVDLFASMNALQGGDLFPTVDALQGAILGLRVTNLSSSSPSSAMDRFKFMSYPGQPRSHAFVANFYARFDDLGRSNQHVFLFGNGLANNQIGCEQRLTSNDLVCYIKNNLKEDKVTAANSIVQGEFAFWHFGVDSDGTMWISKDGVVQVTQAEPTLVLPNVFRRDLFFGKSYLLDDDLNGVVLGFRLDRGEPMTTSR